MRSILPLFSFLLLVATGCGDSAGDATGGSGGSGGSGGTSAIDDSVVAEGFTTVEHIAVDGGVVYFQTGEIGYYAVDGAGLREIGRSSLGPAGFAVRGGVVYFSSNLTIDRYEAGTTEDTWRDVVAIATELDDTHLYLANCDGVGRIAFAGGDPEGMVPGCFDTVGLTAARAWAVNDAKAVAVPKVLPGDTLDVAKITGEARAVLVGTDTTGAYFPTAGAFPLLRVDDDGGLRTFSGDEAHPSLADSTTRTSRYRVVRSGDALYALARAAPDTEEGVLLRLHDDGSPPETLATFRAAIATLAVDETYAYFPDGNRIVRRKLR